MKSKIPRAFMMAGTMIGGSLIVISASCDNSGFSFFRDQGGDYYYDPGYYDAYVPVCDPFFDYCY